MGRPNSNSNTQVAAVMRQLAMTEDEARSYLTTAEIYYDMGREDGQAEAQRFFRLALGIEIPDVDERAYWNAPVPLMEEPPLEGPEQELL